MKPRFKVGDRVVRPEYWGDKIVTIIEVGDESSKIAFICLHLGVMGKPIMECPFRYRFAESNGSSWDYQLVSEEVYNSPLYKAMKEEK